MTGNFDGDEATVRVPAVEGAVRRLDRIEALLERVLKLLTGDGLDPNAPSGMVQRQNAQEVHIADHEKRLIDLEADVPSRNGRLVEWENIKNDVKELRASREAQRDKNSDRTFTGITQALGMLIAGLLGILATLYSKGGGH